MGCAVSPVYTGGSSLAHCPHAPRLAEVTTDYLRVLDELPAACHVMERYANNSIELDHGRLKSE
jgi:hypothetical protein